MFTVTFDEGLGQKRQSYDTPWYWDFLVLFYINYKFRQMGNYENFILEYGNEGTSCRSIANKDLADDIGWSKATFKIRFRNAAGKKVYFGVWQLGGEQQQQNSEQQRNIV